MTNRLPEQGLGNQVNRGAGQQKPQPNERNQGAGQQRGGTANSPGDANESGSAGSTRRDDTTTAPAKPR